MALCSTKASDDTPSSVLQHDESVAAAYEMSKSQPYAGKRIPILTELVGACNLLLDEDAEEHGMKPDQMRPYCVVKFGDKTIHQSTKAEGGCNPIWTLDSQSLFLLDVSADDLIDKQLSISIWTKYPAMSIPFPTANNKEAIFLGQVQLDGAKIITHCSEERIEVDLERGRSEELEESFEGTLALRFRLATESDIKFVKAWTKRAYTRESSSISEVVNLSQSGEDDDAVKNSQRHLQSECSQQSNRKRGKIITEKDEAELMGDSMMNAVSTAALFTSSLMARTTGAKKSVRVKPYADPSRAETTKFMSPGDIKLETKQPSTKWTEAGSGNLGKLYVEILSCHDLPNLDAGEAVGNVTDSFVAAVFEDVMVQTPVIDDELSPCWLPWTDRAFIFNMMHPSSTLYLSVFDYDIGPLSSHDPIGRVAVNISHLQRDTVYTLIYNLYPSSNVTDRTAQGSITIRLRIEMNDEKAALMAALSPRPKIHVNVQKEKSFKVVQYACYGEHGNEEQFELKVLRSYINEIFDYKKRVTYSIGDALRSLIFWRGQVKVFNVYLPLDSMIFFWAAKTLVERPYMLPAFMILSVPWILIANMRTRTQDPWPWNRCPSFLHYLWILKTGKSRVKRRIDAMEGWDQFQKQEEARAQRLQTDLETAEKNAAMQQKLNEIGDDKISTAAAGSLIPIDLLNRLGRYQGIIGRICRKIRAIQVVLLWEESILAFWITAVFLAAGIVALFLPWAFILTWTGRILVWGGCGPHMMLVDFILKAKSEEKGGSKHLIKFQKLKTLARIRREDALKLKSVKSLRFGKYITLVPDVNLARHYDRPLPQSTARVWRKTNASPNTDEANWIPGQQLFGTMIPRPQPEAERNHTLSMHKLEDLSLLEARLVALQAAEGFGGGLHTFGKRVLHLKDSKEEPEPDASGYELIPWMDSVLSTSQRQLQSQAASEHGSADISVLAYEGMNLKHVSMKFGRQLSQQLLPGIYELEAESTPRVEPLEAEEVDSVDDHSLERSVETDQQEEFKTEEEGVEIVACDHLLESVSEDNDAVAADDSVEIFETCEVTVGELSPLFRSSEYVQVAFYREKQRSFPKLKTCHSL